MYERYFNSLGSVLPCDTCKNNYRKNLVELPVGNYLDSRRDLTYWGYLLREKVNDELGVPKENRMTFGDVQKYYESMRSSGCGEGVCSDPMSKKKCKVHYITDREEFGNTVAVSKNWPLVVAIAVLVGIIIILLFTRIRFSRK